MTVDSMLPNAPCINSYTQRTKTMSIPFCGSSDLMEEITVLDGDVTKDTVHNLYLQAGVYVTTTEEVEKNSCSPVIVPAVKAICPSTQDSSDIPRYIVKPNKDIEDMPYFVEYILAREFLSNRSMMLVASVSEDTRDDENTYNAYTYLFSIVPDYPPELEHKSKRAILSTLDTDTLRNILERNTYVDAENPEEILDTLLQDIWSELDKIVDNILSDKSQTTSIAVYLPEYRMLKLNLPVVHSTKSNTRLLDVLTKISESPDGKEILSDGWISENFNVETAKFTFNSVIESLVQDISTGDLDRIDDVYFPNHTQQTLLEPALPVQKETANGKSHEFVIEGCHIGKFNNDDIFGDVPEFRTCLEKDNLIFEYMQHFLTCSGGVPVYKYLACLVLLSMLSDRKIVVRHRHGDTYPNICALILGYSTVTHKSTAIDEMKDIWFKMSSNDNFISEYSKEGLLEALSDNSHVCLINDEVGGMLDEMHNKHGYMSAIPDTLCNIFDCIKRYRRKLRKEYIEIVDTFATCLWSTTLSRFQETCTVRDIQSGFLARELIGVPSGYKIDSPMEKKTEDDISETNHIIGRLMDIQNLVSSINNLELTISKEAYASHQSWFDAKTADIKNEVQLVVAGRLSAYVFKIAVLNYMGSRSFVKDVEAAKETQGLSITLQIPNIYVSKAMQIVQGYFFHAEMALFAETCNKAPDSLMVRVIEKIKSAPDMTISRGNLHSALGGRVTKTDLDEVITHLVASRVIEGTKAIKFNGSRHGYYTEYYHYIGEGIPLKPSSFVANGITYVDDNGNIVKDAEEIIQKNEAVVSKKSMEIKKQSVKTTGTKSKK